MGAAFDAFEDAVRRERRAHRMRVASINFWHRARMTLLWVLVAAEPTYWLVRWAWAGFPVVGR